MSMLQDLFDVAGLDMGLLRLLIQRDQNHRPLLGQVEINHADAAALTHLGKEG